MLKVSYIAMIALLTIGVTAIVTATAASALTYCTSGCPPGDDPPPGDSVPLPDEPGGNEPGDELDDPDESNDEQKPGVALDCAIKDEQATTTDLWLVNVGTADLEAGLKIRYRIPATGDHGAFYLPRTIAVGEQARLSDFISEIPVGEVCSVEIII